MKLSREFAENLLLATGNEAEGRALYKAVEVLVDAAVMAEREACAKIAEDLDGQLRCLDVRTKIAKDIRARGDGSER